MFMKLGLLPHRKKANYSNWPLQKCSQKKEDQVKVSIRDQIAANLHLEAIRCVRPSRDLPKEPQWWNLTGQSLRQQNRHVVVKWGWQSSYFSYDVLTFSFALCCNWLVSFTLRIWVRANRRQYLLTKTGVLM